MTLFTAYLSQECEIYRIVEAEELNAAGNPCTAPEIINFGTEDQPKTILACLYDPERFRSQEEDAGPAIARPLELNQMIYTEWPPSFPDGGITNDMLLLWKGVPAGLGFGAYPEQWFNIVSCNPVATPLAPTAGGHHLQIEITRMYNV